MTPKELFINNRTLSDQWNAVAKATWFSEVLMHARAQLLNSEGITPEHIKGAKDFESILLDLAERPDDKSPVLSPGLTHNLDIPIRPKKSPPQSKT